MRVWKPASEPVFYAMPASKLKKYLRGQAPRVKQNHHIGSQSHTQIISCFMLFKYLFHLLYIFSFNSKHVTWSLYNSWHSLVTVIFRCNTNFYHSMQFTLWSILYMLLLFQRSISLSCYFSPLSPYPFKSINSISSVYSSS